MTNIKAMNAMVPDDVISAVTKLSDPLKDKMGYNADLWQNDDGGRMF